MTEYYELTTIFKLWMCKNIQLQDTNDAIASSKFTYVAATNPPPMQHTKMS